MTEHNRPVELDDRAAIDDILATEDVVLLEFYTSGCGACASMMPVLGVVAKQTDATIATCNPGTDLTLVDDYDVKSVPAIILFVDGEEVDRRMGSFVGADDLLALIADHAPDAVPEDVTDPAEPAEPAN